MARPELADVLDKVSIGRAVTERQVFLDIAFIQPRNEARNQLERFCFVTHKQSMTLLSPVEWLDTQMITDHVHLAVPQVDNNDCEHAVEAIEHPGQSEVLVKAKDHLSIGAADELIANRLQLGFVIKGVVNL